MRLFFTRRGPNAKNERGLWEFPGGSVEFGERLADALAREMREEYGIQIEVGPLLDVVDHILPAEGSTGSPPPSSAPSAPVTRPSSSPANAPSSAGSPPKPPPHP